LRRPAIPAPHTDAGTISAAATISPLLRWAGKPQEETMMSEHAYKLIEVVGTSHDSIEDAISGAIEKAAKTVRDIRWFEVLETRGHVVDGKVDHYQVTLKIGFTLA
jgi:flavin-binding protein dodecin